ncbi:MAG: NAD(P)/FAD-dependent oxidoreductase [Chloroflexi bacterium]|nr:NAD(P)/FAD-dependent oxidoreductase [Chloroflexota bacterium]
MAALQIAERAMPAEDTLAAVSASLVGGYVGTKVLEKVSQKLDELPRQIVFVGGGYISFEFAHVAARAGATVEILHRGAVPLQGFDPDLVGRLVQGTRDLGVDVRLATAVHAVEKQGERLFVRCATQAGDYACETDMVVHGAGRVPEIDDLDLDTAGVQYERQGVSVNQYLQSVSNPAVYAAGDAAASPGLPLTPVASLEGEVAASNMLEGNHQAPNYTGIPTVVFTIPPLAAAGLQESAARAQGLKFRTREEDTSGWYSSRRIAVPYSAVKVLVEDGSGRILGAHILGPHAEETINLFALAIRKGLTAADLEALPYAYPTHASDVWYMV